MDEYKQDSKTIAESTRAELLGHYEQAKATAEDNAKQKGTMA